MMFFYVPRHITVLTITVDALRPNVCGREEVQEVNVTSEEPESSTRIFRHQFFTTVSCDATDSAYICTTEYVLVTPYSGRLVLGLTILTFYSV